MLDDTEDDIRPSHFRYARRDEASKAKPAVVPAHPYAEEAPVYSSKVQDLSPYAWIAFCVLGVTVIGYFISLLVRSPQENWTWLDGWVVCAIEVSASIICIVRGLDKNPGRVAPLALGLGLLSWSLGDVFLTIESLGGKTPSVPSLADVFYIGFYPLAYVATVQYCAPRWGGSRVRTGSMASWPASVPRRFAPPSPFTAFCTPRGAAGRRPPRTWRTRSVTFCCCPS